MPFKLDYKRYDELERQHRLVWIVARENFANNPVGYCCGYTYRDLHWPETVAAGDLWFVVPVFRNKGIGTAMLAHRDDLLKELGAVTVYENLRSAYNHPKVLIESGYEPWGNRWTRRL